jgi:hypothetical protein
VEDRYYKQSEWIKLDPDGQQEIRDLRESRPDVDKRKAAAVEIEPKEPDWGGDDPSGGDSNQPVKKRKQD